MQPICQPINGQMLKPKAVFLDRDGTILRHVHYLHKPGQAELLPGAITALETALRQGAMLFLFTNQSGVGRGLFTLADVEAVNRKMVDLLGLGPTPFTDICIATESPFDEPTYRKPSPRFILETLQRHRVEPNAAVMVGDNPSDWQAGINAGIRSIAVSEKQLDDHAETLRRQAGIPLFQSLAAWSAAEWA